MEMIEGMVRREWLSRLKVLSINTQQNQFKHSNSPALQWQFSALRATLTVDIQSFCLSVPLSHLLSLCGFIIHSFYQPKVSIRISQSDLDSTQHRGTSKYQSKYTPTHTYTQQIQFLYILFPPCQRCDILV